MSRTVPACIVMALLVAGCATPGKKTTEPSDAAFRRADGLARTAYRAGDYERAAAIFAEALARAEGINDIGLAGSTAYNLATAEDRLDRFDQAEGHVLLALAHLRQAGQSLDDAQLLHVAILHHAGSYDLAAEAISAYLEQGGPAKQPSAFRAELLVRRALIAAAQEQPEKAVTALARAGDLKPTAWPSSLQALYAQAEGEVHLLKGEQGEAQAAFEREAALRKDARQYGPMARAYLRAADTTADNAEAARAYLQAARMLAGQGAVSESNHAARKALRLARKEKLKDVETQARALTKADE